MIQTTPLRRATGWAAALCAAALCLWAPIAQADDLAQMREKVEAYSLQLAELRTADTQQATTQDLARCELWLREAQGQLAKEDEEVAARYLRRVEAGLEMLTLLIERAKADAQAFERETAAVNMEKEANQAKITLQETESREAALQKQVEDLRKTSDKMQTKEPK
jgi:hypothetical protein